METSRARNFKMTPSIKREIVEIVDARIREAHVTKEDFSELKGIVKELGLRVGELGVKVGELAEAQKRTELRVEELAEAQKRTEIEVGKLAEGLNETRGELGGLSRSMSYAFENESYRFLPEVLKAKFGIEVREKIVRADVGGKEINIFCRAEKGGREVMVVGEAKLRLDERRDKKEQDVFDELEDKVKAIITEYGEVEIARVLVAHYATKGFVNKAKARGVIVVQSYEW